MYTNKKGLFREQVYYPSFQQERGFKDLLTELSCVTSTGHSSSELRVFSMLGLPGEVLIK